MLTAATYSSVINHVVEVIKIAAIQHSETKLKWQISIIFDSWLLVTQRYVSTDKIRPMTCVELRATVVNPAMYGRHTENDPSSLRVCVLA